MMTARVIEPRGRGFLLFDSHPVGCEQVITDMAARVWPVPEPRDEKRPVALVIGSSAGYGLAATLAGSAAHGVHGVGVAFESGRRAGAPATAGWYRTIATDGSPPRSAATSRSSTPTRSPTPPRSEVLDLIEKRFGGIDFLVYSVAAPRRTDPRTGTTYQSVIKPLGAAHTTRTLEFDGDGTPILREVTGPSRPTRRRRPTRCR